MAIGRDAQPFPLIERRPDAARGGLVLAAVAIAAIVVFLSLRGGNELGSTVNQPLAAPPATAQAR
jgi:hypothetical protein